MHEESSNRRKVDDDVHEGAIPAYLMDRETTTRAKVCSYCIWGSDHTVSPIITFFCRLTFPFYVGSQQLHKAKTERESWQMGGSSTQGKVKLNNLLIKLF